MCTSGQSPSAASSSSEEYPDSHAGGQTSVEELNPIFDRATQLSFANLVLHGQSQEIRRLNQKIGELEEKILDKDDEIHNWWTDGKDKGETIRRKDRELAEKQEEIEEKKEEIAALKAELEEFRANQEAKVGGEEGERSTKRRRSR
ncbi:hypothetical protein DID88_007954 [Monilinia fructigena]|uniref:Uncharacterized protein n=1 Tax=Monilinia fructigena TaxID=38457 RepID=A0A395J4G7_9HELO|nr:hypothetical protein DID88_007954 [Monilinia fructigena]